MIRVQDIRRADKQITDWGKWQRGKMPRSAFPLSKPRNRAYRLGSAYRWRVVQFEAHGLAFRLLIAFSVEKEQYRAVLAFDAGRDMGILASYEFHGTHPGWHVLGACGDIERVPQGMMRGPWQRRFPKGRAYHRRKRFRVSDEDSALTVAAEFYRIHKAEGVML